MDFEKDSIRLLKNNGYKITGPRVAVLSVLAKTEVPLSAYEIAKRVPKSIPVNVVTVYRVLEVLERLGIAHRIHAKEGFVRCDFKKRQGCHYFAVCERCGRTREFLHEQPCRIGRLVPRKFHFKNLKHSTEILGICAQCS